MLCHGDFLELCYSSDLNQQIAIIIEHSGFERLQLVVRGTVFARMSPDEKQQLVELLQETG